MYNTAPVLDDGGQLVGFVSIRDAVAQLVEDHSAEIVSLNGYINGSYWFPLFIFLFFCAKYLFWWGVGGGFFKKWFLTWMTTTPGPSSLKNATQVYPAEQFFGFSLCVCVCVLLRREKTCTFERRKKKKRKMKKSLTSRLARLVKKTKHKRKQTRQRYRSPFYALILENTKEEEKEKKERKKMA